MTAATSVAYGLVAELAATDPTASRSAAQRVDTVWREMHLFSEDVPSGGGRASQPKRTNKPSADGG
ncbi:hypothetical protein [Streptomyces sp. AcE210]|uniref:hypothetical protein n=1 Tax=Streptomyces sp. AcE210 TaxID=2292703 RepID=UPI0010587E84|nr:hypothetical protein [Streptomyces sp. AcE210]